MPQSNQSDSLEIELIRSLFEANFPAFMMSAGFLASGGLALWQTGDPILALLLVAGAVASAGRIALLLLRGPEMRADQLTLTRARRLERHFAVAYINFALVLGMFGARAMQIDSPELHMMTICLLLGYGAGVAANICLRPDIAVPSMIMSSVPAVVLAFARTDPLYWATALLTTMFLVGGIKAVRQRYARAAKSIGRRLAFSALARQDGLTALPNRLALREWFDQRITFAGTPGMVAVHYLDLDGFKPVNDRYGHPVGDALLVAVSQRIAGTIRQTDTAARLGGDEFALVQCGIESADEAAQLAERLTAEIARPFRIDENTIRISTCVGYVVAEHGAEDLECLLSLADEALYASKRAGGGITRWQPADDWDRAAA